MEEEWRGRDSPVPGHRTGPASVYMYTVCQHSRIQYTFSITDSNKMYTPLTSIGLPGMGCFLRMCSGTSVVHAS